MKKIIVSAFSALVLLGGGAVVVPAGAEATPSPTARAAAGAIEGEVRYSHDTDCVSIAQGNPYTTNMMGVGVSQIPASASIPDVGEVFYVRVLVGVVGFNCADSGQILPTFVPPLGVELALDAEHPARYRRSSIDQTIDEGWKTTGMRVTGPAPDGTVSVSADGAAIAVWEKTQIEIELPFTASRPLVGIAAGAPSCPLAIQEYAQCSRAEAYDHFQVTLQHNQGYPRPLTSVVGLFAEGGAGTPGTTVAPPRVATSLKKAIPVGRLARKGLAVTSGVAGGTVRATYKAAGRRSVSATVDSAGRATLRIKLKGKQRKAVLRSKRLALTLTSVAPDGRTSKPVKVRVKVRR